jgi:hypothetical protein
VTRCERWTVWGGTVALTITGLALAGMKYLLEPTEEFAVVNHPLQPLALKLHILSAPVLVFGLGLIATRHVLPHLRAGVRSGRRSGLVAALVVVPMILTGYLIQVVTNIPLLTALAWSHLGLGTLFGAAAGAHAVAARLRRRTQPFSPWPAKSPRVRGRKSRSTASQTVLEKG